MSEYNAIKILGREYRVKTDLAPAHLQQVADRVEHALVEARRSVADTQDAAVLAALNLASELIAVRGGPAFPRQRIQALIELVDSV